ncbi:RHS repeat-associated core domain-containing protein [Streptomyces qinglanensis]|uniref:RHS repeat-associated core domain-containing protein n=1 Tax=Streptomyces qinglanensis TaxID=943816 RepID=UPI003D71A95B
MLPRPSRNVPSGCRRWRAWCPGANLVRRGGPFPGRPFQPWRIRTRERLPRCCLGAGIARYGIHGKPTRFTDAAGNTWKWTYDARGRQTGADDPDKGKGTIDYDTLDQPVETTDARGITLTTTYDALGRKTARKEGDTVRAAWSYDKEAKGQLDSTVRHVDGDAYTSTVTGYTDRYQPSGTTVTIPGAEGSLAGSYSWRYFYNAETGARTGFDQPSAGGLPSERMATGFTADGLPTSLSAGGVPLVNDTAYDPLAHPVRTEHGLRGRKLYETRDWDEHTGRLTRDTVDGQVALRIEDTRYSYDKAGNTTRIAATASQDEAATRDVQCFTTDPLQRLTAAWTTADPDQSCTTPPDKQNIGGSDPYWQTFGYDKASNRTREVRHSLGTQAGGNDSDTDQVRSYTYGTPGEPGANTLHSVTTTGSPAADGDGTEAFDFDAAGNTTTRSGGTHDQNLTWDSEGHLASVKEDDTTTRYLYTPDGDRLLAHNPDGSATLYLPEGNELTTTSDGEVTGARYYAFNGRTVATRATGHGIHYLFPDQQGTALIAVAFGSSQIVTRRKQLPFGGARNGAASGGSAWPGTRGFVDGTQDPTGTTHLGAREYDPALGRFLSVDPMLAADDQRQHNPYQYGGNNPATHSDPSGEAMTECVNGQYSCSYGSGGRVEKVTFGKNYRKVTHSLGGKISRNYWAQQANSNYRHVYRYGHGSTHPTAKQLAKGNAYAKRIAAARKAAEQRRQRAENKAGILGNLRKGNFGAAWNQAKSGLHDTFGTWEGWKNRVIPGGVFVTCLIASAGLCTAVGAIAVVATFGGDGVTSGNWKWAKAGKGLAWTFAGGFAARRLAGSWRASAIVRRTRVKTVYQAKNVTIYGYRKTVEVGGTYANVSLNTGLSGTFCGAGAASPGNAIGVC